MKVELVGKAELIEIEESVDPLREVYVEVCRRPIRKVWVSESSFDSGLYERLFETPEGTEAVLVGLMAKSGMNDCTTRLQRLGQYLVFPGDDGYSPEKIAEKFSYLGLPVREL